MKKVLIIIKSFSPGGAERQIITDANELNNKGYCLTIIYLNDGSLRKILNNDIKLIKFNKNFFFFNILLFLFRNRFKIIFSHMFWANRIISIPAFISCHRLIMFEHGLGNWRKCHHRLIARFISNFAYKVIVSSEASKLSRIEQDKVSIKRIMKIPNSFSPISYVKINDVSDNNDLERKFIIGFVGRFEEVKQLEIFIEICSNLLNNNLYDFKIVLVGDGLQFEKINQLINESGYQKFFFLPGIVDNKKLAPYYSSFNVFVLPSKKEDFSISLLEASSFFKPCLAFDVGGNSEIIIEEKTGYIIKPYNVNELVYKIIKLYNDPGLASEMGSQANEYVKKNFSIEKRINALESLINKKT